jgi:Rod binding domain-containing protein
MDTASLLTLQSAQSQAGAARAGALTAAAHAKNAAKDAKLGQQFEAMALSQLLAPMWEGLQTDGPFGGGQAEETMRSFYVDAIAKEMAKKGGIGISAMMQKELLKLQGAA